MCLHCQGLPPLSLTLDRKAPGPRSLWERARKVEARYVRQLRKIAKHVGDIVLGFPAGDPDALPRLDEALSRYAEAIKDWARATGWSMITEVAARDKAAWISASREMGAGLRREIAEAPTGLVMRKALDEQTRLITSLPTEAAERVRKLTLEGIVQGSRASEIAKEIMRTGEVTRSRADLIGRTEVSRTASALTQARAEHVGSTAYIWRTSRDSDVRPSHRAMEGQIVRWDDPPTLDGMIGHAGALPNCRCWSEPIIPDPDR